MKEKLEAAACFFDYHSGWLPSQRLHASATGASKDGSAIANESSSVWVWWGGSVVALGSDCRFVGHGDAMTIELCQRSCDNAFDAGCNLVNFRSAIEERD